MNQASLLATFQNNTRGSRFLIWEKITLAGDLGLKKTQMLLKIKLHNSIQHHRQMGNLKLMSHHQLLIVRRSINIQIHLIIKAIQGVREFIHITKDLSYQRIQEVWLIFKLQIWPLKMQVALLHFKIAQLLMCQKILTHFKS